MSIERFYCTLEEGSFAHKAITEFQESYSDVYQTWCDFAKKHGVEDFYCGQRLMGLKFDHDQVPLGWNSTKLPAYIYKPTRTKVCMEAYKEFKALPSRIGMFELAKALKVGTVSGSGVRGGGFSLAGPAYETIGEQIILDLPEGSDIPEGATKMKTSEYWVIKEAAVKDDG